MVTIEEIQAAYYMVAATGVLVAAVYYTITLRTNQNTMKANLETRQFQLLMELSHYLRSKEGWKDYLEFASMNWSDYNDFEKKYGSDVNPESYTVRNLMTNWYNTVGLLVKYGMIDRELVYDYVGQGVIRLWNSYGEIIRTQRHIYDSPRLGVEWEFLYSEMIKIAERRGNVTTSKATLRYSDEVRQKLPSNPN